MKFAAVDALLNTTFSLVTVPLQYISLYFITEFALRNFPVVWTSGETVDPFLTVNVSGAEPQGQDPDGHEANRVPANEQFLPGAVRRGVLEARVQYPRCGL